MDLGFIMASHWYRPLWFFWLSVASPIYLLLLLIFPHDLIIVGLVFWWLKPVFEPLLMDWLGKALFNDRTPVFSQLRQFHRVISIDLIGNITWRRFFPSRSYNMAVQQLEKLTGTAYRNRIKNLQTTAPKSGWLTLLCLHLETILQISTIALLAWLLPVQWQGEILTMASLETVWFDQLSSAVGFLCVSFIAPFYVSAGFSLYINSRTHLEAWDIEVAFRRMAQTQLKPVRHKKAGFLIPLILLPLLASFHPPPVQAIERDSAKSIVSQVLEQDDFGTTKTIEKWQLKNRQGSQKDAGVDSSNVFRPFNSLIQWVAKFIEIVAWIAIAIAILWLIGQVVPRIRAWPFDDENAENGTAPKNRQLRLEPSGERLPDNPIASVLNLIAKQRYREAMSLLYRGTIHHYQTQYQLDIPDSATEDECLHIVNQSRPQSESAFFGQMARHWQKLAYAGQAPSEEEILELCRQWEHRYVLR